VGPKPRDVLELRAPQAATLEEVAAPEDGVRLTQACQSAGELEQVPVAPTELPVHPADLVVLAVGVVVAPLRAPHLVAGAEHRHALREKEGGEEVPLLFLALRDDLRIVGGAFDAEVVAEVVVLSVAVVLSVDLV